MSIPLFDCQIDPAGVIAIASVLSSGQLVSGPHVSRLESELSGRLAGRPVVALSDVTQALELALKLSGVGAHDEVLTLSYNCLSSNSAIHNVGGTPIWVDIDPSTASMDVAHARSRITALTRAIVVYHVAGYPADIPALRSLCDEFGLTLIEDANNALGAQLPGGAAAGTLGDFAVFSFYANRQVSAIEGAALVCPDGQSADKARRLRRFGIDQSSFRDALGEIDPLSDVTNIGIAANLPNANAALARYNLQQLDDRLRIVRDNASAIVSAVFNMPGIVPVAPVQDATPAYWALLLLHDQRDRFLDRMKSAGVQCSKLHQPNHAYSGFGVESVPLPGTKQLMDSIVAVPCGWWVGAREREKIIGAINAAAS